MFTVVVVFFFFFFLQGPDATDESCWLKHSHESLYMNMVKWKIKHHGQNRYVICFNVTKVC